MPLILQEFDALNYDEWNKQIIMNHDSGFIIGIARKIR